MNIDPLFLPGIDLLLKSTAILLVTFTVQHFWKNASAATLNVVWLMAFGALLLLPVTRLAQPRWATSLAGKKEVRVQVLPVPLPEVQQAQILTEVLPSPAPAAFTLPDASQLLAGVWILGAASVMTRRLLGTWQLRRIKKQSDSLRNGTVGELTSRLAREWGVDRAVELRASKEVPVPLTWGTWRPLIMLPQGAALWQEERLMAALQHELGHIRRHDVLTRGLTELVCAIYWINPLVWLGAKAMRLTQERACDDLVLNAGVSAESYATQLLESARSAQHRFHPHLPAVAMAQPSTLETRLLAIMDEDRDRRPTSRKMQFVAGFSGMMLLMISATMQLRAQSQSPADDPSKPVPQIHMNVKIIEASVGTLKNAMKGLETGKALSPDQAAAVLKEITETHQTDTLSTPSVTTLNGQQATIQVGSEYVGPGHEKETTFLGVLVNLLPTLTGKGEIKLKADGLVRVMASEKPTPVFREFKANTEIVLEPNQTAILEFSPAGEDGREKLFLISANLVDGTDIKKAPAEPVVNPTVEARARKIIIPNVMFHEASLQEAVDYIRIQSKEFDPEKQGINMVIQAPKEALNARLTLSVKDLPLSELLRYVSELSNLKLVYNEKACVFVPVDYTAEVSPGSPSSPLTVAVADKNVATKAAEIIIPNVEFKDATLSEALEFLRVTSRQLDPEKKGVNVILQRSKDTEGAGAAEPVLSLSLKEIPLSEALKYVAALAGLKLSAQENAYVLSPLDEIEKAATGAAAPMELKADSVTTNNGLLQASGHVTVTFGKLTIHADRWEADSEKQTGLASGNVEIIQELDTHQSTILTNEGQVELNLKDGTLTTKGKHKIEVKAR